MQSTKSGHDSATVLLIFVACFCSLVQYPVSYVTYFCYTAPLTLLAATALFTLRPRRDGHVLAGVLLGFFFLFGACALLPKHIFNPNIDTRALHPLQAPRAGSLRVDATTPDYDELVSFLQSHSSNGLLYAANDSPQLYFLTGLTDPTRDDTGATPQEVRRVLQTGDLRLVALNDAPFFKSSVISVDLRRDIARSLPNSRKIGAYTVLLALSGGLNLLHALHFAHAGHLAQVLGEPREVAYVDCFDHEVRPARCHRFPVSYRRNEYLCRHQR